MFLLFISCFLGVISQVYPQGYTCVPVGLCPSNPGTNTGTGTPDIRIVTPGQTYCPAGTVPCIPGGTGTTTSSCGVRGVQTSDADGQAVPGSFPWQAYMVNQTGQYFGSGVLLDPYNFLTAAHKVMPNVYTPYNIRSYFGVWDPRSITSTAKTATRIIVHPSYNPTTLFNDIAIVRLDSPVAIGTDPSVGCAALPTQSQSFTGRRCIVAGWGQNDANPGLATVGPLKQVTMPIVDYITCRTAHSSAASLGASVDMYLDPLGDICAGGESSKDACTNDGGAPLMCTDLTTGRWTAVGLVIWGKGCGTPGLFGVYTNVANYRTWIDSTLATLNAG